MELHELMANIASWGFVVLMAWRIFLAGERGSLEQERRRARRMRVYVGVGLGWYVLLAITGWLGGQLVFAYGAGVQGWGAGSVLTLEDLNTLAARQTDENLRYSEWMHHVFGLMTLGLAASLLAQAVWPKGGRRLWWIVPVFLVAGGIFLFFMADRDLYALTDWRQLRDREVQLHKSLAIIMGVIGVAGLWKGWGGNAECEMRNAEEGGVGARGGMRNAEGRGGRGNSRLVAVLALIGGAMLFTHVHSVAPYANVAAGVYIAHVVMGLVALAIGVTRLMQDWVSREGTRRGLRVAFAGLMAAEAVLLVTYNEGLPWFIGYGRYNRWGVSEQEGAGAGTIAPFGAMRARLQVDQGAGKVVVDVLDRFEDRPVAIAAGRPLKLLVMEGGREMGVDLRPVGAKLSGEMGYSGRGAAHYEEASRFEGEAAFLERLPAFSARLALPVGRGERLVMGYFDPWVTPVVAAVPPNERALFECPMHEGMRSVKEGVCPICGMELQPIRAPLPAGVLHDAGYDLRVAVEGGGVGKGARFRLDPMKDGRVVRELAIVHEQPIHLIVVSEDLSYFDHVHPVAGKEAVFDWTYVFPRAGRYLVFAELTPKGDRAQAFRVGVQVSEGETRLAEVDQGAVLSPDAGAGKVVRCVPAARTAQESAALDMNHPGKGGEGEAVEAQLLTQPRTIAAGLHTQLIFRLADGAGKPVVDLEPYLGAMGHCVIISEDTGTYLHSHPEQFSVVKAGDRGGPVVAFHAVFPKAGRYRVWGQFKRAGAGGERMVIAAFDVEVRKPWVPAGVLRFLLNE
jgi:FtsH-binding integral membrane protein